MANMAPINWVGNGLSTGISSGVNYFGGAALDRLSGLDPMAALDPLQVGVSTDPMLQMLMQMLMGLMGNSSSSLLGPTPQSLSDMVSGLGGSTGSSFGGGGGGGGGGSAGSASSGGGGSSYSGPVPDRGPVAPGTAALLDDAGKMVGLNENSNTKEIMKVTGESGINPSTTPWCAAFAINMMKDHGVLDTTGLDNPNYCPSVKSWAQDRGIWGEAGKYTPKPGDAILYDWEGDGTSDHIGIVEAVKNGKVYTIEGNSSDSVKRNSYSLSDSEIDGYVVSQDATRGKGGAPKPKDTTSTRSAPKTKAPTPKAKPAPSPSTTATPKAQPAAAEA